ncbi:MAG: 2-C-methyl-D-erythritol 4-phosphate cytidylyltransferase, partial [Eubacteriales bacterium]|nr:2-C-methyl-D-erythritol 4-phosphate cytidylyltransferase [Eubacteriales bacterium]
MISAIIPAAGESRRMETSINKQFLRIAGQPVLTRTLLSLRGFVDE